MLLLGGGDGGQSRVRRVNRTETTTFFGVSHLPSTSRPPKTTTLPPTAAAECISLGRGIDPVTAGYVHEALSVSKIQESFRGASFPAPPKTNCD